MVSAATRAFVMVWDGMRPDLISPDLTPNLARLAEGGVRFRDSHAVFPTVTRINSASLATGCQPASHGILGNSLYVPEIDRIAAVNMGDHRVLATLARIRGGRVVPRDSLADLVGGAGGKTVVVSTGSPGSALLCHPRIAERTDVGDRLLHPVIPTPADALEPAIARLGPMPAATIPNQEQNAWFTRVITDYVLPDLDPTLLIFWHTDPDKTQHHRGFGSPEGFSSIRDADTHLGRVLVGLETRGRLAETVVAVVSDHLYVSVPSGDRALLDTVAAALAAWEHGGPLFSNPIGGQPLPGTFPLSAVGLDGDLAPDLVCALAWDDTVNEFGMAGRSAGLDIGLMASHGGISAWEVNNTFVLGGAGVKSGLDHTVPAGNVDLSPTLAHLLGVGPLADADGRVLSEALLDGPDPADVPVEHQILTADLGAKRQSIRVSTVGSTRYLDVGRVES